MTRAMLLQPVRLAGRIVYEAVDRRSLSQSGNAVGTSYEKGILDLVGLLDQDDRPIEDVDVDQTYRVDPEVGELVVENRMPIQEDAALDELLEDPAMVRVEQDLVAD